MTDVAVATPTPDAPPPPAQEAAPTPPAQAAQEDAPTEADLIEHRMRDLLRRKPSYPTGPLVEGYLLPYINAKFEELLGYVEYLQDQIEQGPEEPDLMAQAQAVMLLLAQLLDAAFLRAGYTGTKGLTDKVPADLKSGYEEATRQVQTWMGAYAAAQAQAAQDDEDDADAGEDDDDDATASAGGGAA